MRATLIPRKRSVGRRPHEGKDGHGPEPASPYAAIPTKGSGEPGILAFGAQVGPLELLHRQVEATEEREQRAPLVG